MLIINNFIDTFNTLQQMIHCLVFLLAFTFIKYVVLVTPSGKIGYQLQRQFLRMRYLDGSFAGLIHGKLVLKSLYGFGAWIGAYMILANIVITGE